MEFEKLTFRNGPVQLNSIVAGPATGPLLILLHGFPEFSYGWRKQIGPLAAAGFRVVVPDMRGYNESSKRPDIVGYSLPFLSSDVISIADSLERKTFFLAGHDWGAAVAWHTASTYGSRISRLIILNTPHPAALIRCARKYPAQLLRSWYMFLFQIPLVPEWLFSAFDYRGGVSGLMDSSRPGTFTDDDLKEYRKAWSRPGAVTGMINYYRALFRHRPKIENAKIELPVLILWGKKDRFLIPELADESLTYCSNGKLVFFPETSHWIQHEEPEKVTAAMLSFLQSAT